MTPVPFVGYAPDSLQTTPGVITNCSAIVPTVRGFASAPSAVDAGLSALGSRCYGASYVRKLDDSVRIFGGTASQMAELAGTSWVAITGATLTGLSAGDSWTFAQFGDATLFAAKSEIVKFITTSSAMANTTSTAPRGAIVETANNFVFLFNVQDQGAIYDSSDRPHGWWCAAKGGYSSWVPSVTTEAATGALTSTAGKITAGKRFGYQVIAYKLRSMYVGTYVGATGPIWDFQLIPGEAGALANAVVVNVGTSEDPKHIIMGYDNFYSFDGGRPVPIGNPIRETVFGELNYASYYVANALHDTANRRVFFYYPTGSSGNPDKCVVYNYATGAWGRDDREIEAALQYIGTGPTFDSLGSSYSTFDDFPNAPYDTAFVVSGQFQPSIISTDHKIKTLSGPGGTSTITTGDYGDDQQYSTLLRVRPAFLRAPESATFRNYYRSHLSDALTADTLVTLQNGRFDVRRSSRWHRGVLTMTGTHEILGLSADLHPDGAE